MSGGRFLVADDWDRICEQRDLSDRDWAAGITGRAEIEAERAEEAGEGGEASGRAAKEKTEYGFRDAEYAKAMRRRPEYFADMYRLTGAMERYGGAVTMPFRKTPMFVENPVLSASLNAAAVPEFGGRMDHYAEELRRLIRENGVTIVMVLHDLNHAIMFSDYLVAIKDGTLHSAGTPQEVITQQALREIFDIEAEVITHPVLNVPVCLPFRITEQNKKTGGSKT